MKKIISLFTVLTVLVAGSAMAKPHPHSAQNQSQMGEFMGDQTTQQCLRDDANCRGPHNMGRMRNMGGFDGPSISLSTVEQAKQMSDDQKVVLKGHIVQSLGGKDYIFKDDTGTIQVEIDHKRWRGQVITPNDLVEIHGEVDKDWKSIEIDVKRIIKVNPDK